VQGELDMVLPLQLPKLRPINAYLDPRTVWAIEFDAPFPDPLPVSEQMTDDTAVLLALAFRHRFEARAQQQVVRFVARGASLSIGQIGAADFDDANLGGQLPILVRDASGYPYVFDGLLSSKPPADSVQYLFHGFEAAPSDIPYLALRKWPRRADFLHRVAGDTVGPQPSRKR